MKHPVQSLKKELDQIVAALEQRAFFSLTGEETQSLREEAGKLLEKLASIQESYLTIGLLGGTGVGKSTLMNALAGSEIASASHRRPHTDQALVYRHVGAIPPPTLVSTDLPWREITHEAYAIQQIFLCDLPDFDSLMGEHREYVLSFLEHLDVLIWVTSPEKYADGRFYEFLQMVPKAEQNFYFVLNKADLLYQGKSLETGYEQLASVTDRFQEHIKGNGVREPLLFVISAQGALDSDQLPPWNQLATFKRYVFQQRDIKQITAIKASNLDVEVQNLMSAFKKEVLNLETFDRILENSIKDVEEQRSQWIQAGQKAIDLWLGKYIKQDVLSLQRDPSLLVGPGYALALLFQEWKKRITEQSNVPSDPSYFAPPEEIRTSFRRRLEWLEDRINQRMLRKNLPSSFKERFGEIMDVPKVFEELGEHFFHVVELRLAAATLPSFWGFKIRQFITYLILFGLFLLAVGGETAWRDLLDAPGGASILRLFLSGIHTLFSTKGLAALVSYALLNLFLGLRFYRRYRGLLKRSTQKIIDSLKADLGNVWEMQLDAIVQNLSHFKGDIQSQISAISALKQDHKRQ
ncbi:MAG: 50S ribosome-binding GTPase [Desulfobacteraceae bacterium]|nr:MAG: 50S ribosome-binding GTPase [Desulfobacteraceae bacterium]